MKNLVLIFQTYSIESIEKKLWIFNYKQFGKLWLILQTLKIWMLIIVTVFLKFFLFSERTLYIFKIFNSKQKMYRK